MFDSAMSPEQRDQEVDELKELIDARTKRQKQHQHKARHQGRVTLKKS